MKYRVFSLEDTYKIEFEDIEQSDIKRLVKGACHHQKMRVFINKFDGKYDPTDPPAFTIEDVSFDAYASGDTVTAIHTGTSVVSEITSGFEFDVIIDYADIDATGIFVYIITATIDTGEKLVIPYYVEFLDYGFPF
jgi:hypothetical protein